MGEYTPEEGKKYEIRVIVDPDEKTLKFIDNGIGMVPTGGLSTVYSNDGGIIVVI